MDLKFADRMNNAQKLFIREILKVAGNPEVISFVGRLPIPNSFPVKKIQEAADDIRKRRGKYFSSTVLQKDIFHSRNLYQKDV